MSLLQYLVLNYVHKYEATKEANKSELPVPEPSDISESAQVDFDKIQDELRKSKAAIKECENHVEKVTKESAEEHIEPFKSSMTAFLDRGWYLCVIWIIDALCLGRICPFSCTAIHDRSK